jgi:glycosyltransferase involved in cell wall biosynthesis
MKLMVVGHPFLLAHNQKKYVAMKQLDPELRLRLVVPSRWRERFDPTDCQVHPALIPEEVVPLKAWPSERHMTYLHSPLRMAAILREFQPDAIHIEEEPQALITVETIALQRVFARNAAVTLFSWDNLLRPRRFPMGFLKRALRAYSLRRVAGMICGNRRAAELLNDEGRFKGVVEVVPQYGLDVTEHQPGKESHLRAKLGLDGSVVVSYVGRLVPEKGLRLLIDALDHLPSLPWKLLLVGAGSLEDEIRKVWMTKFPGRIVLVPAVPYERVPEYIRCSDIYVLPSHSTPRWAEQFGLSLAQAMMLGIPSIGSSSGAIPEVLGPGGLVFQEGNTEALTRALDELLRSPARREELGALGRQFALQNYATESISARYLGAFERARSSVTPVKEQLESAVERKVSSLTADRRI